jgi:hypothetical protein
MSTRCCTSFSPTGTARLLADLDAAMRQPLAERRAVDARMRFYETAVREFAIRRLNSLGEIAPRRSRLSERSLDVIFEDDRYSGQVVAKIVILADTDPAFRSALVEQEGEVCLAYWRSRVTHDLFGLPVAA